MRFDVKDYFTFSKKEKRAIIILIAAVLIVSVLPALFPREPLPIKILSETDSLNTDSSFVYNDETENTSETISEIKPFSFDPNTVSESALQQMHVRAKLIATIINYRNKGGKFFAPEDLRKLYTIREEEADALIPFVRITSIQQKNFYYNDRRSFAEEKATPIDHVIDINSADIEEVKRLPGVSFSLANKIVKYRDMIGGFKNEDQLKKTYGMNDSIYNAFKKWIVPLPVHSELININKASFKELLYKNIIPEAVAKAIIIYREQHKGFKTVSELMNIPFISKELYEKMAPYLTTD